MLTYFIGEKENIVIALLVIENRLLEIDYNIFSGILTKPSIIKGMFIERHLHVHDVIFPYANVTVLHKNRALHPMLTQWPTIR